MMKLPLSALVLCIVAASSPDAAKRLQNAGLWQPRGLSIRQYYTTYTSCFDSQNNFAFSCETTEQCV
jgi:hypothetical protein